MQIFRESSIGLVAACALAALSAGPAAWAGSPAIDFNRDIRQVLSDKCFACHGPDEAARKAGLRLDVPEGAFNEIAAGRIPVVPGDLEASELWRRITHADPEKRMPPASSGKSLTPDEITRIEAWIRQGAEWEPHWAFIPPDRPAPPAVQDEAWVRNPIDAFVLAQLEAEGVAHAPEADKNRLIRRVTYDLTGLPPTLDEIDAFLADNRPDAYERLVERLLASPRYGEHMARLWLDIARYADTNGYHIDNERYMWRWRDWVIDAYNTNKPFDAFTIEQLAGDLLPNPTLDQKIATGFNRNHMINFEGGAIPEEYRTQYVVDRVNTTGTAWLGLTVSCAQCHDHKYDPISQEEFFQLYAFFNTVSEVGLDGRNGNAVPFIKAPSPEQQARLDGLNAQMAAIEADMQAPLPGVDAAQAAWEQAQREQLDAHWRVLAPSEATAQGGATLTALDDGSLLAAGENPAKDVYELVATTNQTGITAIKLEALTHETLASGAPGRSENGNFVLTEFEADIAPAIKPDETQPLRFAAANADFAQDDFDAALAIDGNAGTGWAVAGDDRKANSTAVFAAERPFGFPDGTVVRIRLRFESEFGQHAIGRFRLSASTDPSMQPIELGPWYINGPYAASDGKSAYETAYEPEQAVDLAAQYPDKRLKWSRAVHYGDGAVHQLYGDTAATYLYREIEAPSARPAELGVGSNDAVKIWLNGKVVHDQHVQRGIQPDQDRVQVRLEKGTNRLLMKVVNYGNAYAFYFRKASEVLGELPLDIQAILAKAPETRTADETQVLKAHYRRNHWDRWPALETQLAEVKEARDALDKEIPTTMVMAEMEEPRDTHLLLRGQYDLKGDKVAPGVPAVLPALDEGTPRNRLGLAKWLVSADHPLTARVVMNRFWYRFFGTGIVKTVEDFGAQGEWPSHPELLDWLATEFIESGWDMKHMQRLIVTSATYRQSSRVRPELFERDPENRLLARGPRFRLDAEAVRDTALAVSGLMTPDIGGPSVKPYQPKGLWEEVAYGAGFTAQIFEPDQGDALYRRSMYTFWKRQSPPPVMMIFDAPNRETCTASRARTNTPLQALALLNGTQYVEAARKLAERMMREAGPEPEARIAFAFRLATARTPTADEVAVLQRIYERQRADYAANPEAAAKLLAVGDAPADAALDPVELAAWTLVANTVLNLDETITKT